MTRNQIEYQKGVEQHRANVKSEEQRGQELAEAGRANRAREAENERSNRAREFETERSNRAREAETSRANRAQEYLTSRRDSETARSNRANEGIKLAQLDETIMHNRNTEAEDVRSNQAREAENYRSNIEREKQATFDSLLQSSDRRYAADKSYSSRVDSAKYTADSASERAAADREQRGQMFTYEKISEIPNVARSFIQLFKEVGK